MSVIGCGYLGAVHAACMARSGHQVVGIDVDVAKVQLLQQGRAPFYEPGFDEVLASAAVQGDPEKGGRAGIVRDQPAADLGVLLLDVEQHSIASHRPAAARPRHVLMRPLGPGQNDGHTPRADAAPHGLAGPDLGQSARMSSPRAGATGIASGILRRAARPDRNLSARRLSRRACACAGPASGAGARSA